MVKNPRDEIIAKMSRLETSGIDCASCTTSECCTFVKNSMMITPLETIELIVYLAKNNRLDQSLKDQLQANIKQFRLDIPLPGNGSRSFSRRSYTCPFLNSGAKACTISRAAKPYGCLAFNATAKSSIDSTNCRSDQALLDETALNFFGYLAQTNLKITEKFNLNFSKLPIPVAILEFLNHGRECDIINFYETL